MASPTKRTSRGSFGDGSARRRDRCASHRPSTSRSRSRAIRDARASRRASHRGADLDEQAIRLGFESVGTTTSPFVLTGYRHDGDEAKGEQSAKFSPELPKSGRYRVAISYTALANRATNVPVRIHHAGGDTEVKVNQKKTPAIKGVLHSLGEFQFEAGKSGYVEISNRDTDGHVIIDAVQWLPAGEKQD